MSRESNLLPKSAPVHSQLAESTKQLRIPQVRSPPQTTRRFSHIPEVHPSSTPKESTTALSINTTNNGLRVKSGSPDESPFKDKKRLVDQFYQLGAPGSMVMNSKTPTASGGTPIITRSNTTEDLLRTGIKFEFLRDHAKVPNQEKEKEKKKKAVTTTKATTTSTTTANSNKRDGDQEGVGDAEEDESSMRNTIKKLEDKVISTVKHRADESELEMQKTRTHFDGMKNDIVQLKGKLEQYINLLKDKSVSVDEDYSKLEVEIAKLYKTLATLDQYEAVVESSRTKMLDNKKKLRQLTQVVETTEMSYRDQRQKMKTTKKWFMMCFGGLVLMYLARRLF